MTGAGLARPPAAARLTRPCPELRGHAGPRRGPPRARLGARGPDPARESTKALPHKLASYRPPRASFPCRRVWC